MPDMTVMPEHELVDPIAFKPHQAYTAMLCTDVYGTPRTRSWSEITSPSNIRAGCFLAIDGTPRATVQCLPLHSLPARILASSRWCSSIGRILAESPYCYTGRRYTQTLHGTAIYANQLGWFWGSMGRHIWHTWSVWDLVPPKCH